jgi:hypothetical protein
MQTCKIFRTCLQTYKKNATEKADAEENVKRRHSLATTDKRDMLEAKASQRPAYKMKMHTEIAHYF